MLVRKLRSGVLHVSTSHGTQCLELSLLQRIAMLWTFRNFSNLPEQVLSDREKRLLDAMCDEQPVIHLSNHDHGIDDEAVIGTVDRGPARKPPMRVRSAQPSQVTGANAKRRPFNPGLRQVN